MEPLVDQLRNAPLEPEDGRFPGEAVDEEWEGSHEHAHASARYGRSTSMSSEE